MAAVMNDLITHDAALSTWMIDGILCINIHTHISADVC